MKMLVAVLAGTAVLAAGCGSGGSGGSQGGAQSAADFVRQVTTQFSRGQSGRLWDELLPSDQRIATRARFLGCQPNEGWSLKHIKVLETYNDPVYVAGKPIPAKAVSVQVSSDDGVTTATMHAVSVAGRWHWVLQTADRGAYRAGKCPRGA